MIPSFPARPAKARKHCARFPGWAGWSIGLALLREYLDNTVKTPDDIETLTRLPSLAVVPAFGDSAGRKTDEWEYLAALRRMVMRSALSLWRNISRNPRCQKRSARSEPRFCSLNRTTRLSHPGDQRPPA